MDRPWIGSRAHLPACLLLLSSTLWLQAGAYLGTGLRPIGSTATQGRALKTVGRRRHQALRMVNAEQLGLRNRDLELSFFDQAEVFVKAGSGGQGAATFKTLNGRQKGPPDGGSGGKGGDVIFVCHEKLNTLQAFRGRASFHADNGQDGAFQYKNGANGQSVIIQVPPGTVIYERETRRVLGEVQTEGQTWMAARGGQGGVGNAAIKPTRGQAGKASPPQGGEKRWLDLELKLVADVGLVGCPNAGKSTLLAAVSNAKPKIADYPFTTLVPNLGVCDGEYLGFGAGNGIVISDVPGLLEGAHRGLGLGRAFLRHIERCRIIIHVINGDSPDPVGDLVAINQELALFNPVLAVKPQVVVLNKIDLSHVRDALPSLKPRLLEKMGHSRLLEISAASTENCKELMLRVRKLLDKIDALAATPPPTVKPLGSYDIDSGSLSIVEVGPGEWRVVHDALEDVAAVTDWDYYGAPARVIEVMEAVGASQELIKRGAKEGDTVWIAEGRGIEFEPPFEERLEG